MEERRLTIAGNSNSNNGQLPSTMIEEILSRLPVKSLCRFKCVSKPWSSLISEDPGFVASHLCKGFGEDIYDLLFRRRRRVIFTDAASNGLHSMHLDYDDEFLNQNNEEDASYYHDNRNRNSFDFDWCNKAIQETTTNTIPTQYTIDDLYFCNVYGLGFDSSTHQHKVVNGVVYRRNVRGDDDEGGVEFNVYALETNSWRQIQRRLEKFHCCAKSTLLKLVVVSSGSSWEWLCVTLEGDYGKATPTYNEFWVMKEYGVGESWTKMRVSIPYWNLSHSGFWTKSHDLMVFEEELVMYNFNDHSFRNLCVREISEVGSVETYLESLVSLK
ncbi:hypothetical protein GBA52_014721 [Prunus armeniaca]|nr:hypothetical protein GBA52_014721 [Prunus armeniaca]